MMAADAVPGEVPGRVEKIRSLDDANLSDTLGGEHDVDLKDGVANRSVIVTAEKGTLTGETNGYDNAGAIYDLFESIQVVGQGDEVIDLPGRIVRYLDILADGQETNDGSGKGQLDLRLLEPFIPSKMTVAKVRFSLRSLSDISDADTQSGTTISVSVKATEQGEFSRYLRHETITDSFNATGTRDRTYHFDGILVGMLVEEDGATVDHVKLTEIRSGKADVTLLDEDLDAIRFRNRKRFGVDESLLPNDIYFLPLSKPVNFNDQQTAQMNAEYDVSGTGSVNLVPLTLHRANKTVSTR